MKTEYSINYNAETVEEAQDYLAYRYKQLLKFGIKVVSEAVVENNSIVTFYDNGYGSIYILKQFRGKSIYKQRLQQFQIPILTIEECDIISYLLKIRCSHKVLTHSLAYKLIQEKYGDQRAKRSGVPLIYHIDEGGYILNKLNADEITKDAYYLHPLLQSDGDLKETFYFNESPIPLKSLILAMEYRATANSYLSKNLLSAYKSSPLPEVNQMLIADKIQNYKDFMKYHHDKHEKSKELFKYFHNWFKLLNIKIDDWLIENHTEFKNIPLLT